MNRRNAAITPFESIEFEALGVCGMLDGPDGAMRAALHESVRWPARKLAAEQKGG